MYFFFVILSLFLTSCDTDNSSNRSYVISQTQFEAEAAEAVAEEDPHSTQP